MDTSPTSQHPLLAKWYAFPTPVKVVVSIAALLVLFVVLTAVRTMVPGGMRGNLVGTTGMGGAYAPGMAPSYEIGAVSNTKVSSSRIAMDYDESYYPQPPQSGGIGVYEESEYETRNYRAHIRTAQYAAACTAIENLKPLAYVVFEQANRGEQYCAYRFKVERASVDMVLAELRKLNPRDLSEQTEVVKHQLLEYTSALDVLKKREELLAKTLTDVSTAYDELVTMSKDARDVETLAKVIDGKLNYIERLSQQRLQVATELESVARARAELTDRVEYVYFDVSVEKLEYIDMEGIKDSWTYAVRAFVSDINETLQGITFGVFALLLWLIQTVLQALVFFVVVLVLAKYGWRATKKFWQA